MSSHSNTLKTCLLSKIIIIATNYLRNISKNNSTFIILTCKFRNILHIELLRIRIICGHYGLSVYIYFIFNSIETYTAAWLSDNAITCWTKDLLYLKMYIRSRWLFYGSNFDVFIYVIHGNFLNYISLGYVMCMSCGVMCMSKRRRRKRKTN